MRIAYWLGGVGDKFGSLERYNILLAEACLQRGHELVVIHDKPNTVSEYAERLCAARAELIVIGDTYACPRTALGNASRFIRSWKPDIVHTHFVNPLALPMLKLLGVPLLYQTYHTGIDHPICLRTRMIRCVVQLCTRRVLAVSERMRRDVIRAGVMARHARTLPLGLPIRDFLAATNFLGPQVPTGYNDPGIKIIITVGRFFPEKGMRYVVEAAVEVAKQRSDVLWWLVGRDGPEREYAYSLVRNSGQTERILFLGQRNDVPALMKKAYVQVVGSLYEGLPLMTLESSACGVPTVGTQIGGLDEVVLDGVTGILAPRCSGSALAEATLRLLDHRQLRDQFGQAARSHVEEHYDAEVLVRRLLDMYEADCCRDSRDTSKAIA